MLISQQQIHQSSLVENFSIFDAWWLTSNSHGLPGAPTFNYLPNLIMGNKQGFGIVYGAIQAQSAMLSFNDINRILTAVSLIMVPSFLLLWSTIGGTRK
jgi:hypothetical protein